MNKKIVLTIVLIIVAVLAVFYFTNNNEDTLGNNTYSNEKFTQEQVKYFEMETYESATSNGLIPIEGFDADLLLGALPGLEKSDFEGVKTYEGTYYYRDGNLEFERLKKRPISTIEKTVNTEGYEILLQNLSDRLNIEIKTNDNIDEIVEIISGNNKQI